MRQASGASTAGQSAQPTAEPRRRGLPCAGFAATTDMHAQRASKFNCARRAVRDTHAIESDATSEASSSADHQRQLVADEPASFWAMRLEPSVALSRALSHRDVTPQVTDPARKSSRAVTSGV